MSTPDQPPTITPFVYEQFRKAVELGKWPNGSRLTEQQLEICMEAIIRFEHAHIQPEARTGFVEPKKGACDTDVNSDSEQELRWHE